MWGTGAMPERWQAAHIFGAAQMPGSGPLVAGACSDGALRMWCLRGAERPLAPHAIARLHPKGMGSACAWHADGYQLASVATDGSLAVMVGASAHVKIFLFFQHQNFPPLYSSLAGLSGATPAGLNVGGREPHEKRNMLFPGYRM